MNSKSAKGLTKHADFVLLDMICLQVSFVIAYWIFREFSNPYKIDNYQYQAVVLLTAQMLLVVFSGGYSGILRRGRIDELFAVLKHIGYILLISFTYLFIVHKTAVVSRLQFGGTAVVFILLDFVVRTVNKYRIYGSKERKRSIVIVTTSYNLEDALVKIRTDRSCFINRIFLLDKKDDPGFVDGIPVYSFGSENMQEFVREWVDEVVIIPPAGGRYHRILADFSEQMINSGITVSCAMTIPIKGDWTSLDLKKVGEQKVFTASLRLSSRREAIIKRTTDIVIATIGCIITGLLTLVVGPLIYIKSPGPIFFVQERIGKNGKPFRMYKFRTMYPDAEERRVHLMDRNKIKDGMMFKIDDDPRIIGSERKDRKGRPCGIGNIMRKYSIDEFPQFFNVLKGDMSIVGWRPCMPSEWEKYHLKDRIRASMKPGITGLWQVSGRSNIIDFDEVVQMDREYVENWTIGTDIRIILKTIWVVISGRGAA